MSAIFTPSRQIIFRSFSLIFHASALMLLAISCQNTEKREIIALSGKWNFAVDSLSAGDSMKWPEEGLPAGLVKEVTIPHTWNTERPLARYP